MEIELLDSMIKEVDGKKVLVLDGYLPQSKVDEIINSKTAQYKAKAETELATARADDRQTIENLQAQVDTAKATGGDQSVKVTELTQSHQLLSKTLSELQEQLATEKSTALKAKLDAEVASVASGMSLVEGGNQTFALYASNARNSTGEYPLSDGTIGDIGAYAEEWKNSPAGKNLIRSDQNGGGGAGGPANTTPAGALKPESSYAEYKAHQKAQQTT